MNKAILTLSVIAALGLPLSAQEPGKSTLVVHDQVNGTSTRVTCDYTSCAVSDEAQREEQKAQFKWCRSNHIKMWAPRKFGHMAVFSDECNQSWADEKERQASKK